MNWVKAIPLLVLTVGLWTSWVILLAGVVSAVQGLDSVAMPIKCHRRRDAVGWVTEFV